MVSDFDILIFPVQFNGVKISAYKIGCLNMFIVVSRRSPVLFTLIVFVCV